MPGSGHCLSAWHRIGSCATFHSREYTGNGCLKRAVISQVHVAVHIEVYDDQNRLTAVWAADDTVLANYTYDALGRRIAFEDAVAGVTTRYYYDGVGIIEERDGNDQVVRYHVNGAQYIDERVATYETGGPGRQAGFTYYLLNGNYSIAGTGNADGSVIERLDYSATGDFAGGGPGASSYYHDVDLDTDIDLADFVSFQACFEQTTAECLSAHDFDTLDDSDGDVDLDDYARFFECSNGPFVTPDQACGQPTREGPPPPSGTFTLHGRPVDILSDGHSLLDFRARLYDPVLGRFLQRDPLQYFDGPSLYEAFRGNPLGQADPTGRDSVTVQGDFLSYQTTGFAWDFARIISPGLVLIDHPQWPFAFIMKQQDAMSAFNTGPFEADFYSVFAIMQKATTLATRAGTKRQIVAVFDKHAPTLGWITPDELIAGERAEEIARIAQQGLLQSVQDVGGLTQVAFTVTTGALAAPGGAGAAIVDVGAAAVDIASGDVSLTRGAVVITAVAAGAALHLRFADDAVLGAGGAARRGQQLGQIAPNIRTGTAGRIESVFAKLEPHHLSTGTRTTADARQLASSLGTASDEAGHVIGRTLGGRGGATSRNIIPQSPHVNRGEFRAFEEMIAQRVAAGDEVFVRIVPRYRGGETRPFEILYQARINGKTTSRVFPNP